MKALLFLGGAVLGGIVGVTALTDKRLVLDFERRVLRITV